MDALGYIEQYAKNKHADEPNWLQEQINLKIKSVGGLLSKEGAVLLIAGEHGFVLEEIPEEAVVKEKPYAPITEFTELSDASLGLIFDTTDKGSEYRKYPKEPLVVRVLQIYDAKKPQYGFARAETGVRIGDNTYFNFEDRELFVHDGKTYPANLMSTAIQQVREMLIGKSIAIFNWELSKTKKGWRLSSTSYTYFKVIDLGDDPVGEEILDYGEVDIEEIPEELC